MDKSTQELLYKLRFFYGNNGSGYNSDFTLTLQKAADLIESLTKGLPTLIIGTTVSIDVSTGDSDAFHRLFGKVDSVQMSDGKNGFTLLVENVEQNY